MEFNIRRFRFGTPLCSESEIDSTNEEQNTDHVDGNDDGCDHNLSKRAKNIFNLLAFKRKYISFIYI